MCREIISEFESFMYLINEIVTQKILRIGLNSRSDMKRCCLFCSLTHW